MQQRISRYEGSYWSGKDKAETVLGASNVLKVHCSRIIKVFLGGSD